LSLKTKIQTPILIVLTFIFFGCSTTLDATYDPTVMPPSDSQVYKTPSSGGKRPATQKPYKIRGVKYTPIASANGFVQTGKASWYGKKFHGRKTSNGETYNMYSMTAAHKTLPMNTWVSVHNLKNNKKIVVRVNDRGPFVSGRIIDLSYTGAKGIGIVGPGTGKVRVTALGKATSYSKVTKAPVSFKPVNYLKGNFTVQVGAFKVKENAQKYRYKLSKQYQNAHIEPYNDGSGTFYRVRIGKFGNLNNAIRFSEQIAGKGFNGAFPIAE
jgi:rare lipoprotein A